MRGLIIHHWQRFAVFGTVVAGSLLVVVWQFFPDVVGDRVASAAIVLIAGAVLPALYLAQKDTHDLRQEFREIQEGQVQFVEAAQRPINHAVLNRCLSRGLQEAPGPYSEVRIFALTSLQIASALQDPDVRIGKLRMLLNVPAEIDDPEYAADSGESCPECGGVVGGSFGSKTAIERDEQIRAALNTWTNMMVNRGGESAISDLEIRTFAFEPTEYCVILDDRFMIFGSYTPSVDDSSGFVLGNATSIDSSTHESRTLIRLRKAAFDAWFQSQACTPNPYQRLVDESKTRGQSAA